MGLRSPLEMLEPPDFEGLTLNDLAGTLQMWSLGPGSVSLQSLCSFQGARPPGVCPGREMQEEGEAVLLSSVADWWGGGRGSRLQAATLPSMERSHCAEGATRSALIYTRGLIS